MLACPACSTNFSATSADALPKRLSCGHTLCSGCVSKALSDGGGCCCPIDKCCWPKITQVDDVPTNLLSLVSSSEHISALCANFELCCPFHGLDFKRPSAFVSEQGGHGVCVDCAAARQSSGDLLIPIDSGFRVLVDRVVTSAEAARSGVRLLEQSLSRLDLVAGAYVNGMKKTNSDVETFFASATTALSNMKATMKKELAVAGQHSQQVQVHPKFNAVLCPAVPNSVSYVCLYFLTQWLNDKCESIDAQLQSLQAALAALPADTTSPSETLRAWLQLQAVS